MGLKRETFSLPSVYCRKSSRYPRQCLPQFLFSVLRKGLGQTQLVGGGLRACHFHVLDHLKLGFFFELVFLYHGPLHFGCVFNFFCPSILGGQWSRPSHAPNVCCWCRCSGPSSTCFHFRDSVLIAVSSLAAISLLKHSLM